MSETLPPVEPVDEAVVAEAAPVPRPQPIRSYLVQALRQRLARVDGAVRAALQARIDALSGDAVEEQGEAKATHGTAGAQTALGQLVGELDARRGRAVATTAQGAAPAPRPVSATAAAAPPSLLQETRAVWQKVRTQSHLRRARNKPLENAGPLNSTKLVGRALDVIGEVSIDYQQQFIAYLDVLAELDALLAEAPAEAPAKPKRPAKPRAPRKRKPETPAS